MKFGALAILIFTMMNLQAKDKALGRKYFLPFLGHLHENTDNDSNSLTIVQCSHSVQILEKKNVPMGWTFVKVGEDKGYIRSSFLGDKRPRCFQEKYQRFYNKAELDITEMYFWGRLSDHYLRGQSRVK